MARANLWVKGRFVPTEDSPFHSQNGITNSEPWWVNMIWQIKGMMKKIKMYRPSGGPETIRSLRMPLSIITQVYSAFPWASANMKMYLIPDGGLNSFSYWHSSYQTALIQISFEWVWLHLNTTSPIIHLNLTYKLTLIFHTSADTVKLYIITSICQKQNLLS